MFKKNLYWIISVILFGLVTIFSAVMLITLEVSAEADETSIGFIFLGNRSEDEKETVILQGIQTWKDQAQYTLRYQGYQVPIDLDIFVFNIEETINGLVVNQNNPAIFTILESQSLVWIDSLTSVVGATIINEFDQAMFFDDVMDDVMTLSRIKTYELNDYLSTDLMDTIISSSTMDDIITDDVDVIIENVSEIIIPKQSRFSLLDALSEISLTNEQLSILASGILSVIQETHLTSLQFNIYQYLPIWATQGQNVRIMQVNGYDLTFYNGSNMDYRIRIDQVTNTSIRFEFVGYPYITVYESTSSLFEVINYQTIIYDDETIDQLTPGVIITETDTEFIYELIVQAGSNGSIYETIRTMTPHQGDAVSMVIFYEHYLPVDEIIHRHIVEKGG